jgi:hypothetical protein
VGSGAAGQVQTEGDDMSGLDLLREAIWEAIDKLLKESNEQD